MVKLPVYLLLTFGLSSISSIFVRCKWIIAVSDWPHTYRVLALVIEVHTKNH